MTKQLLLTCTGLARGTPAGSVAAVKSAACLVIDLDDVKVSSRALLHAAEYCIFQFRKVPRSWHLFSDLKIPSYFDPGVFLCLSRINRVSDVGDLQDVNYKCDFLRHYKFITAVL